MFCPNCGIDEKHANQFCRGCGTNLRSVRDAIARPDTVTASAASARDEIGRAVAAKIRETQDAYQLKKVVEDVLPEIEKFLESPEERKLRRIRVGTIIALIGFGVALAFSAVSIFFKEDLLVPAALGAVAFFIGMAFIINGRFLTVPERRVAASEAGAYLPPEGAPSEMLTAGESLPYTSVTENTTLDLSEKVPIEKRH